jgi:2-polyprenyl-3-methyl-5-hydroxy-6-metoxy-1,4-benzoquinol methylase
MRLDKFNDSRFFIILQLIVSVVFLFPYFLGKQILYGEGQYYLSWTTLLDKIGNTWMNTGLGTSADQGIGNTFPVIHIWSFLEKLGVPFNLLQFIWFFLLFFLPFLFTFLLINRVFRISPIYSFLATLFYIYNPVVLSCWPNINPWSMPIFYLIPLFWLIIGTFWNDNKKTFLYSTISFFSSLYICANPPYVVIFFINIITATLFFSFYYQNKIDWFFILKKNLVIFLSIGLTAIFIIINTILGFNESISKYLNAVNAVDILRLNSSLSHLDKVFMLHQLFASDLYFNFLLKMMNNQWLFGLFIIPFALIVANFKALKKSRAGIFIFISFLIIIFFVKALNAPAGFVYDWLFHHVPLFNMFKTPQEKFSPLLIFVMAVGIALIFKNIEMKKKVIWIGFLSLYISAFFIPILFFKLIPDMYYLDANISHFQKRSFFNDAVDKLNQKKLVSNVISLPGGRSYLVLVRMNERSSYLGLDPITSNIYQGNVEAFSYSPVSNFLYESLFNGKYQNVLSLFNVKYIILNKSMMEGFGFMHEADSSAYENILGEMSYENISGVVNIYNNNLFTPHIYVPKNIFVFERDLDNLSRIVSNVSLSDHSAIILKKDNNSNPKIVDQVKNLNLENNPAIEFRKINAAKYVIKIHGAKNDFPLVISDSFNSKWKLYFSTIEGNNLSKNSLEKYSIISGNENEQATKEEVSNFIKKGVVTSLGSANDTSEVAVPDFISKDYGGTIQNDNLQGGHFYDVILKNPVVGEDSHFVANGYANGWIISLDKLCRNNSNCVKNKDGSYDFEIVSEFYPQKYFYIGIFISCITFLIAVILLIKNKLFDKKRNNFRCCFFSTHFESVSSTLKKISHEYKDKKYFCDLGCGRGERTVLFKESGRKLSGIDYDDCQSKYFKEFDFKKENIFENSFLPESFDMVFSYDVIEHLDHPEKLVDESQRLLRKNGMCVMATPNKYRLFGFILIMLGKRKFPFCLDEKRKNEYPEFWHLREYTSGELKKLLEKHGFRVRKVYKIYYGKPSSWGIRSFFGFPFYHNIIVVAEKI